MEPYELRPIAAVAPIMVGVIGLKRYSVVHGQQRVMDEDWSVGAELASKALSQYTLTDDDAKVGYLIYHKGRDSDHVIVSHWVERNMLRMIPFKAVKGTGGEFRSAVATGVAICVWDMLIHFHERNAYVEHMMKASEQRSVDAYLNDVHGRR